MRVVIACHKQLQGPGGLAAYQHSLVRALQGKHSVELIALRSGRAEERDASAVSDNVETKLIGHPWLNDILFRRLTSALAPRPSCHRALELLLGAYYIVQCLRDLQPSPNVVHFIGTGWLFFSLPLQIWARQTGAVFTVLPAVHPNNWGDDCIDLHLYNRADAVLCLSQSERDHLVGRGADSSRLRICGLPPMCSHNGSGDRFRQAFELEDRPVVLFIGRRDEGKGYPALLRAWRKVLKNAPSAVLAIAGPYGEQHRSLLNALPRGSVLDLGVCGEELKADALAACNVFCLPSAHESFGLVYVEAWSYGKPVICGTAPACRELIQDGLTGLHSNQDPVRLSADLLSLLQSPEMANALGMSGKVIQTCTYTYDRMLHEHLAAWEKKQ